MDDDKKMWSKSAIWSLVLVIIATALPVVGILSFPGPDAAVNAVGWTAIVFLISGFILSIFGIHHTKKFDLKGRIFAFIALVICVIIGGLFLWEWLSK